MRLKVEIRDRGVRRGFGTGSTKRGLHCCAMHNFHHQSKRLTFAFVILHVLQETFLSLEINWQWAAKGERYCRHSGGQPEKMGFKKRGAAVQRGQGNFCVSWFINKWTGWKEKRRDNWKVSGWAERTGERQGRWCRWSVSAGHWSPRGCSSQDTVTLKGVNADWAKAHQFAHVQTHSLQRAQIGFTADTGVSLQPSPPPLQHYPSTSLTFSGCFPFRTSSLLSWAYLSLFLYLFLTANSNTWAGLGKRTAFL